MAHFSVCEIGLLGNQKRSTPQSVPENRSQIASENKAADSTLFYLHPTHRVTVGCCNFSVRATAESSSQSSSRPPALRARKTSFCRHFVAEQFLLRATVFSASASWEEVADYVIKETSNSAITFPMTLITMKNALKSNNWCLNIPAECSEISEQRIWTCPSR